MRMTMAEKILARASGLESVRPDQIVVADVDLALSHENADLVRKSFAEIGVPRVWDPSKIVIILDHRIPAESEKTATTHKAVREFVAAQGIANFYDVGRGGICHQVLAERGHVRPGMVVVGTDSHTTTHGAFGAFATGIGATEMAGVWTEGKLWFKVPSTIRIEVRGAFRPWISAKDLILYLIGQLGAAGADYRAVEFDGPAIRSMTVASRMVLANLSMEMGAKVAFTPVDELSADEGAEYERIIRVDASTELDQPQIACPHSVDNVRPLSALAGLPVHQAVLGSCTNGRLEDLEVAARIVKGRTVHPRTRLIIIPASQQVYREAMRRGYLETLVDAGAIVNPPGCGPCVGVHQGILAAGENCVSSTNRNFHGRMGSKDSFVYLASPAVVAASAIAGELAHPESVVKEELPCPATV
ncbi:3-isopropylmalate dehydratase large subunit [uncultured Paludibaculum sp.]|uniref:3-isopropylmalate dehydratase large subunit n=1 Tax=uncultured Paludibaculum sp. TaxID=1765020 RepID=UPI002AAAFD8A|nr:3-isopropylmalate dehydratase large subunit [uncultured Paludibaculum sp.]